MMVQFAILRCGKVPVFKLIEAAQKSWRRIDGKNRLPEMIKGVKFNDGIRAESEDQMRAAWAEEYELNFIT
jgi:hypothetical protein